MDQPNSEPLSAEELSAKIRNATTDFNVNTTLQVVLMNQRTTSTGNPYFSMHLGAKHHKFNATKFIDHNESFEALLETFQIGNVIQFSGRFQGDYNSIRIYQAHKLEEPEYKLNDFILLSKLDINSLVGTLDTTIAKIQNQFLKRLLDHILNDETIRIQFIEGPSSTKHHHAYKYGNLEHTISMINMFENLIRYYLNDTLVNIDLIYTGILLHDIGKIYEYKLTNGVAQINNDQNLIGHITLGDQLVKKTIDQIPEFPEDLETKLRHLILSHHGRVEWGSPVEPQTTAAQILHYLDMVDSRFKSNFPK